MRLGGLTGTTQLGAHCCPHSSLASQSRRQASRRCKKIVLYATESGVAQQQAVSQGSSLAVAAARNVPASTSAADSAIEFANAAVLEAGLQRSERLKQCRSWQEVLRTAAASANELTSPNIAVALKLLANMARNGGRAAMEGITSHPDFTLLLRRGLVVMYGCHNRDLANSLWSLAVLHHNDLPLMSVLTDQASRAVDTLNAKDLALITWSYATLRAPPGQLLEALALAAMQKIDEFEPQGLSMLVHSFAMLEYNPGNLLSAVAQRMEDTLPAFNSQAVANIMLAMGKLKFFSASLCAAVDQHVAQQISGYRPQEVCNLLWAFVTFAYVPVETLAAFQAAQLSHGADERLKGMDCASLIWAFASLGFQPQPALIERLCEMAAGQMAFMKQQETCNMLWGLAVLGACEVPIFQMLAQSIIRAYSPRRPDARVLRQLFQARMLAECSGVSLDLPEDMRQSAATYWMQSVLANPMSTSHRNVAQFMKRIRLAHVSKQPTKDGLLSIDLALQQTSDKPIAIQVTGPHETAVNTGEPLGQARSEKRLLEARGWTVVYLPTSRWPPKGSGTVKQAILSQLLSPHGVVVPQHEEGDAETGRATCE
ncbi:hypothetical protein WJX72_011808 [[Myrmecia] bisecta]|uniref:RNA-editing substrate-binding complex 6 protein domain-containing protein n=1 Tax=[Myrmecia] bisecta TaxID=41462 RepID=A0AAW1Q4Y8_9CHLO